MNYTKKQIEKIESELTPVDIEELYDEMLDEVYGQIDVGGLKYYCSIAQRRLDPIAHQCGVNDCIDSLVGETLTDEINGNHYNLDSIEMLGLEVTE